MQNNVNVFLHVFLLHVIGRYETKQIRMNVSKIEIYERN